MNFYVITNASVCYNETTEQKTIVLNTSCGKIFTVEDILQCHGSFKSKLQNVMFKCHNIDEEAKAITEQFMNVEFSTDTESILRTVYNEHDVLTYQIVKRKFIDIIEK